MRTVISERLEQSRLLNAGVWSSDASDGPLGCFLIMGPRGVMLKIISSGPDSEFGWEHVSVSAPNRTPNWAEMCFVKDLFWDEEECVVEYHPPRSEYVNHHPHCLHLWKPIGITLPLPPSLLVGPRS